MQSAGVPRCARWRRRLPIPEHEGLKIPGIVYGAHVCTTVIPLLAEAAFKQYPDGEGPGTLEERMTLIAFYFP